MSRKCMIVRGATGDYGVLITPIAPDPLKSYAENITANKDCQLLFINPTGVDKIPAGDSRCAYLFLSSWSGKNAIANFQTNHSFFAVQSFNAGSLPTKAMQKEGLVTTSGSTYFPFGFDITDMDGETFIAMMSKWIDNDLIFTDTQAARLQSLFDTMKAYAVDDGEDNANISVIIQSMSDGLQ